MMNRLEKRWWAVGVIWGVALAISGWNIQRISTIQERRQDLEILKMDLRYLKTNSTEITNVRERKVRLVHRVKSYGLGFLVVENDLKRISQEVGLSKIRVDAKNSSQNMQSVPVDVLATGSIPAIVKWLMEVEKAHPYMTIAHLDVTYDRKNRTGQMKASFAYHYLLSSSKEVG